MESLPYFSKIPCPPQADCRELQISLGVTSEKIISYDYNELVNAWELRMFHGGCRTFPKNVMSDLRPKGKTTPQRAIEPCTSGIRNVRKTLAFQTLRLGDTFNL